MTRLHGRLPSSGRQRQWPPWLAGYLLLSPAMAIMLVTLALPVVALITLSFWTQSGFDILPGFTLQNYWNLIAPSAEPTVWMGIPFPLADPIPAILTLKSLIMSFAVAVAAVVLAYPMAYFLAFRVTRYKAMWLVLLTIPFWTSYLLRIFSWKVMLGYNGAINTGLKELGIISVPLDFLLYNPMAVVITLAHATLAFSVLPIYVSLEKIDRSLLEAATDLGDSRWQRFWRITFPLSAPGTIAASLLVFIPVVGDYVTPALVGGPGGVMIGNQIQELFLRQNNAPQGAALSIVMMAVIGLVVAIFLWAVGYAKMRQRNR